jgi:predicted secreted hydrolase
MFYSLRRRSGARDPFSAGTWTAADGSFRHLSADDLDIAVLDHWKSARGGTYPARWRLRTPALGLDVELRPILADQELDTTPRYWEGAVDVRGRLGGAAISGRGYVELTGYARIE